MRSCLAILISVLFFLSCEKTEKMADPYKNLSTTLIFEEDFNDISEWVVDTSIVNDNGPFGVVGSANRCKLVNGCLVLRSYHLIPWFDSTENKYYNPRCQGIIKVDLGNITEASRYLLELDLINYQSRYKYSSTQGSHNYHGSNSGAILKLNLYGVEFNVFGLDSTNSYSMSNGYYSFSTNCRSNFDNTQVLLILDRFHPNEVVKINGKVKSICSGQHETAKTENSIYLEILPTMKSEPYSTAISHMATCRIDNIRLSVIN